MLRWTPILGSTRVPCLAAETYARPYPPPGVCVCVKFWVMGFVVLVIWVNGYMVFSLVHAQVLKKRLFFSFSDLCNVVENFNAFIELG